jgi:hypothetical protein
MSAIAVGILSFLMLFIKESRPTPIVAMSFKRVETKTPDTSKASSIKSVGTISHVSIIMKFMQNNFFFPVQLFLTEPIIAIVTVMSASVFALLYLFTEAWPVVYKDFGFTEKQIVLVPLALNPGLLLPFLVRIWDIKVANKMKRKGIEIVSHISHFTEWSIGLTCLQTPETKLRGFFIAAPVYAIGLWWFAWTVPKVVHVSPWFSIAALVPIAFATNEFDHVLSSYLTDAYGPISGSANAPLAFLRAVLSAIFPLFGGQLFESIGSNWAGTLLASLATVYCVVAALFWRADSEYRQKSPWIKKNAVLILNQQAKMAQEDILES